MKLGIKILSLLFLLALVFTSCNKLEEIKPDDTLEQVFNRSGGGDLDEYDDSSDDDDDDDDSSGEGGLDTINDDDDDEDEDDIEDGAERDTQ